MWHGCQRTAANTTRMSRIWPKALTDILFKTGRHAELADDNGHGEGKVDNKDER